MINLSNLELKNTSNKGKGIFSKVLLPKDSFVLEFQGSLFKREDIKDSLERYLQIGLNLYLGPSGGFDDYVNHSCNPNCHVRIVGNRAFLYSNHQLNPNDEITFDYSTTSTDDEKLICQCGSYHCRKIIFGYKNLSENIKNKFNINHIADYLK